MRVEALAFTLGLSAAAMAQGTLFLPASLAPNAGELANFALRPFDQQDVRVQMFYDATEVGASSFVATEIAFRYDGPIPAVGSPGPFPIQRVRVSVGSTAVALPEAGFARNLTAPLTTVFDAPVSLYPDPGSAFPHPWGGPNGTLTFPFNAPLMVTIPTGGWFVVELSVEGSSFFGQAHVFLDGAATTGGPTDGMAVNSASGCAAAAGQPPAVISTTGIHAPGAAHFIGGANLGANAPVFAMLGLSDTVSPFGPLPFAVPNTTCRFLTSFDLYFLLLADATGSVPAGSPSGAVAVPAAPGLAGLVLHEQLLSFVSGANPPWGIVLSDKRTVTLGTLAPPGIGTYTVSGAGSASSAVGDEVTAFGYAMRLTTL